MNINFASDGTELWDSEGAMLPLDDFLEAVEINCKARKTTGHGLFSTYQIMNMTTYQCAFNAKCTVTRFISKMISQ